MNEIRIVPIRGIPEVSERDDVAVLVARAADGLLENSDIVVIAHKVISKSEGRWVRGGDRRGAAAAESARILRRSGDMIISETRHGFVCANAGVDGSNVEGDRVVLLPIDPDLSARRIRARLQNLTGKVVAVIVSDTFGRAWRLGQTNIAIGIAGMAAFTDYRGTHDAQGRPLSATMICTADEIASAAELVMGKAEGIPAAVVKGARVLLGPGSARDIVRPPAEDLFR